MTNPLYLDLLRRITRQKPVDVGILCRNNDQDHNSKIDTIAAAIFILFDDYYYTISERVLDVSVENEESCYETVVPQINKARADKFIRGNHLNVDVLYTGIKFKKPLSGAINVVTIGDILHCSITVIEFYFSTRLVGGGRCIFFDGGMIAGDDNIIEITRLGRIPSSWSVKVRK